MVACIPDMSLMSSADERRGLSDTGWTLVISFAGSSSSTLNRHRVQDTDNICERIRLSSPPGAARGCDHIHLSSRKCSIHSRNTWGKVWGLFYHEFFYLDALIVMKRSGENLFHQFQVGLENYCVTQWHKACHCAMFVMWSCYAPLCVLMWSFLFNKQILESQAAEGVKVGGSVDQSELEPSEQKLKVSIHIPAECLKAMR